MFQHLFHLCFFKHIKCTNFSQPNLTIPQLLPPSFSSLFLLLFMSSLNETPWVALSLCSLINFLPCYTFLLQYISVLTWCSLLGISPSLWAFSFSLMFSAFLGSSFLFISKTCPYNPILPSNISIIKYSLLFFLSYFVYPTLSFYISQKSHLNCC